VTGSESERASERASERESVPSSHLSISLSAWAGPSHKDCFQLARIVRLSNFGMPNFDSVNFSTNRVVQKLTESRFGISKFGIPIEIRSLMSAGIGCNELLGV